MIISGNVYVVENDREALRETDLRKAVLRVKLLDVTKIDDVAQMVASGFYAPEEISREGGMAFALEVPSEPLPNRQYELAAHLDVHGNGRIDRGDFITTEAFPWPQPSGTLIFLKLRRVFS